MPLLAPVLGIEVQTGYDQVAAEGRKLYELIAQAVQAYLLACLAGGSGLVVAEDLHWFDPSTREVLSALLDAAAGRLLVVMTGRPGGWLPTDRLHKVFDLAPLTDEQTDALIGALNPGMTADQRAAVAARCDGVPFYIEQVVNGRSETGVPEALYEPLFARLRASPKMVPVVEAAAILGRQIDRDLLCSVVDVGDDEVDDVIHELEDALVLEPSSAGNWRFRHELLREIAAELAPPSVRRGLHAKVADVLIGAGEPDWRLVAAHYEHAERFDDAASAYQRASNDARRRGALPEARACLTLALAQLNQATPRTDRDRREAGCAGNGDFSVLPLRDTKAETRPPISSAASSWVRPPAQRRAVHDAVRGVELLPRTRRPAPRCESGRRPTRGRREDSQWLRPAIEVLFGAVAWLGGEFDVAHRHLQRAMADLAAADQHRVGTEGLLITESSASVQLYLAFVALPRGDLASAEGGLAQAARLAEGLGFPATPYMHAYLRSMTTWLSIEAGQLDRAAVLAAEAHRSGRAVWLRHVAAGGGHLAGSHRRPGHARRPCRPDRASARTSRPSPRASTPCARSACTSTPRSTTPSSGGC